MPSLFVSPHLWYTRARLWTPASRLPARRRAGRRPGWRAGWEERTTTTARRRRSAAKMASFASQGAIFLSLREGRVLMVAGVL